MSKLNNLSKAILLLIGFDGFTKLLAFYVLDNAILNPIGFGGDPNILEWLSFYPIIISFSVLGSILIYGLLKKIILRKRLAKILSTLSFLIFVIILSLGAKLSGLGKVDQAITILLTRIALTISVFLFFKLAESSYMQIALGLLFCGAISNLLSFFYPPYHIVDFFQLDILSAKWTNFADLYIYVAIIMLIASPAYFLFVFVKKVYQKKVAT